MVHVVYADVPSEPGHGPRQFVVSRQATVDAGAAGSEITQSALWNSRDAVLRSRAICGRAAVSAGLGGEPSELPCLPGLAAFGSDPLLSDQAGYSRSAAASFRPWLCSCFLARLGVHLPTGSVPVCGLTALGADATVLLACGAG